MTQSPDIIDPLAGPQAPQIADFNQTIAARRAQYNLLQQNAAQPTQPTEDQQPKTLPGDMLPDPLAQAKAQQAQQGALEREHSITETIAGQYARGGLDFFLSGGALLGMGIESLGTAAAPILNPLEQKYYDATGQNVVEHRNFLQRFGRDLGQSATGQAALSSGMALADAATGRTAAEGWDYAQEQLEGERRAWPTLSTVSRIAGTVASGVGLSTLAAPGAAVSAGVEGAAPEAAAHGGRAMIAAAGTEGAAAGAQAGYDEGAPLKNVLTSALIGGALGVGIAAAPGVIQNIRVKQALGDFADERTLKALGARGSDLKKLGATYQDATESMRNIARTVRDFTLDDGTKVFNPLATVEEHAEALGQAIDQVGKKIGALRGSADDMIAAGHPELAPNVNDIARKIDTDIAGKLRQGALSSTRNQANELDMLVDDLQAIATDDQGHTTVDKLFGLRRELDERIYGVQSQLKLGQQWVKPQLESMQQARGVIEDAINDSTQRASLMQGSEEVYANLKKDYRALTQARQIAGGAAQQQLGNRVLSPSDYMVGAAELAGDLAGGSGLFSLAKAAGVSAIHKVIREKGSGVLAAISARLAEGEAAHGIGSLARESLEDVEGSLSGRFGRFLSETAESGTEGLVDATKRTTHDQLNQLYNQNQQPSSGVFAVSAAAGAHGRDLGQVFGERSAVPEVPLEVAGGREAQEAMQTLNRAQASIQNAEQAAGPNPVQRQAAREEAAKTASENIAREIGGYDVRNWQQQAPSAISKLLMRPALLDQISHDFSTAVQQRSTPQQFSVDPPAAQKLMRDANQPAAIGGLQQQVQSLLQDPPQNQQSQLVAQRVAQAQSELQHVPDAGHAMAVGHALIGDLLAMAKATPDPVAESYALRQAGQLQRNLQSDDWGTAGIAYKLANAPSSDAYQQLSDPGSVREVLRTAQSRGVLTQAIQQQSQVELDAANAVHRLSGTSRAAPASTTDTEAAAPAQSQKSTAAQIKQSFADLHELASKAEDAILLDGGPVSRVASFYRDRIDNKMVAAVGSDVTTATAQAIRPKLRMILPTLVGQMPSTPPQDPPTRAQALAQYSLRLKQLDDISSDDQATVVTDGLSRLPGVPPELQQSIAGDVSNTMSMLRSQLPRPQKDLMGNDKPLSSDQLERGNALWEAVTDPTSIFDDFAHGSVNPQKVSMVNQVYPGVIYAAQAGIVDLLMGHVDASKRAGIPDAIMSQLDRAFGFDGRLQESLSSDFSARMSQLPQMTAQQEQQEAQQDQTSGPAPRPLQLPKYPSLTERLAAGRRA